MKKPSRYMPPYEPSKEPLGVMRWLLISGLACGAAYLVWNNAWVLALVPLVMVVSHFDEKRRKKKFAALYEQRNEQSICDFARSFDRHTVDTWVIRAVYEQIQNYVATPGHRLPLRASDDLTEQLEIDSDDLDMDLVYEIAQRAGRSLEDCEHNPFYGKVQTVGDLVRFFNAQPLAEGT